MIQALEAHTSVEIVAKVEVEVTKREKCVLGCGGTCSGGSVTSWFCSTVGGNGSQGVDERETAFFEIVALDAQNYRCPSNSEKIH